MVLCLSALAPLWIFVALYVPPLSSRLPDFIIIRWSSAGSYRDQMVVCRILSSSDGRLPDLIVIIWSSVGSYRHQMVICRILTSSYGHLSDLIFIRWSSAGSYRDQMIVCRILSSSDGRLSDFSSSDDRLSDLIFIRWSSVGYYRHQMVTNHPHMVWPLIMTSPSGWTVVFNPLLNGSQLSVRCHGQLLLLIAMLQSSFIFHTDPVAEPTSKQTALRTLCTPPL
jgi:hypothetical protein